MNTKDILNSNNFVFKKKFGQNFLLDQNILNNIVKEADITKDTLVIEIGVGAAALTKKLSLKAKTVLGYEIDETLKEPLNVILNDFSNVDIIFDDFLNRCVKDDLKKYEEAAHALCFGGKNFAAFHIFRKKIISHASDKLNSIQRAQRHLF